MNPPRSLLDLVKAVPYFGELRPAVHHMVAARCRAKLVPAGPLIFMMGEPCLDLCILESGRVKSSRVNADGREQVLKTFDSAGDIFCMASAFSTGRHIVDIQAATESRLYLLDMETVNLLVREHPSMGLGLMTAAGEHMVHLVGLAEDLALKGATARLAKHLHALAVAEGGAKTMNILIPRDRLPVEELASILGTVRVHVSRGLADLVRSGAIDLDRGFVRVRDLAALTRLFDPD